MNLSADADALLNNPAHIKACEQLEREIIDRLSKADFDGSADKERYREKLNLMLQVHSRYKRILHSMIATGIIEAGMLDRKTLFNRTGM